jgi:hypothetical protein
VDPRSADRAWHLQQARLDAHRLGLVHKFALAYLQAASRPSLQSCFQQLLHTALLDATAQASESSSLQPHLPFMAAGGLLLGELVYGQWPRLLAREPSPGLRGQERPPDPLGLQPLLVTHWMRGSTLAVLPWVLPTLHLASQHLPGSTPALGAIAADLQLVRRHLQRHAAIHLSPVALYAYLQLEDTLSLPGLQGSRPERAGQPSGPAPLGGAAHAAHCADQRGPLDHRLELLPDAARHLLVSWRRNSRLVVDIKQVQETALHQPGKRINPRHVENAQEHAGEPGRRRPQPPSLRDSLGALPLAEALEQPINALAMRALHRLLNHAEIWDAAPLLDRWG